ncbi:MAG: YceI family protein [Gemmatimonadaceae bacterium]
MKGNLAEPAKLELEVLLTTASIDTRQEQRDTHLRSPDFFDAEKWPGMRFVGKRIKGDIKGEFTLYGDMTIRDVTREIELAVTNEGSVRDPWGMARVGFSAKGKLDRQEFGLSWNQAIEAGGFVVGDEIRISVDVEFTDIVAETAAAVPQRQVDT